MKTSIVERHEVVQIATLLGVAIDAGLSLVAALEEVIPRAKGPLSSKFSKLLVALNMGGNLYDELAQLRSEEKRPVLDELVVKLQVSLQFGTPLVEQLSMLVGTNRSLIAAEQLAIAAKKENLMLLPLVFLILPITVVFALFPSMQYLNLNQ
jgi:tight adherence protein C